MPSRKDGEVIVELRAAALNRRDYWITRGKYPNISLPVILGSDGAGISEGKEVIIDPGLFWGKDPRVQSDSFQVLGLPKDGCFAQFVSVPVVNIYPKPKHLNWHQAAALPLAGVTAYRALVTRGEAMAGQRLLVTGIGGGVAMLAFQFGMALGLEVYVTSGSEDKLAKAVEMGASGTANYNKEDWHERLRKEAGMFDLIIDSAGGKPFSRLLKLCKPGGNIVTYGGTLGKVDGLSPQVLFWRQINIKGSTMGSPRDFHEMLALCETHAIEPFVDAVFDLAEGNEALEELAGYNHMGKLVLDIPQA